MRNKNTPIDNPAKFKVMNKYTLSQFRKSLQYDYLPTDWRERIYDSNDLVLTSSGYIAIQEDTITTEDEGNIYHTDNENDCYCWDELKEEYIEESNSVSAYSYRGREIYTHEDNVVYFDGNYYVEDYLSDNDIVRLHNNDLCHQDDAIYIEDNGDYYHRDDVYYWESDDQYHLEPEEESVNTLWAYSSGPTEKYFVQEDKENEKQIFGFGIEIEKNEMPIFEFNKQEIYDETGAVLEKDSSVNEGFELKTPVYNLLSKKTEERLQPLKPFADIKNVKNAGGHIGFSMEGKTDEELLELCAGYLPLIYAMYKKRMSNSYCQAKTTQKLQEDGEKFQSIRLRGNYIEFRIFSSVKTFDTILFRLNFFRIMAQNLGKSFAQVIGMATNKNSKLYKLLTGDVYADAEKFERLITDAIEINKTFGNSKLTAKTINKIAQNLADLKKNIQDAQTINA